MLIDKSYYDYDYEPVQEKSKKVDVQEARKKFRGFFKHTKFQGDDNETEIEKAERLQREANNNIKRNSDG